MSITDKVLNTLRGLHWEQGIVTTGPLGKSLVVQSLKLCPSLYNPMDCSTPGFPVLHHLPEFAQTHVH